MDMKHDGMKMPKEKVGIHGMTVVGEKSVYLSHLPMFMKPHNFQAIFEASFIQGANSVQDVYVKDRRSNPKSKMYTLPPLEKFQLTTLFRPTPPARSSFKGELFRGHFEREGVTVSGMANFDVKIKRVIFLNELDGTMTKPAKLTYRLFGRPDELFLLHVVAAPPPDFDQIISVKIDGHQFTDQELSSGVEVVFADRANTATARLKEKEKSRAQGHVTGAHQFLNLNVEGLIEFYMEEGDLAE
jgi:hypothetical protein